MKFLALLFITSSFAAQAACPDFSGRYTLPDGSSKTVTQTGCQSIAIVDQFAPDQAPVSSAYQLDGVRHEIRNIFWVSYWRGEQFWREPWSSAVGGDELGFREAWTHNIDGSITDELFDSETGALVERKTLAR